MCEIIIVKMKPMKIYKLLLSVFIVLLTFTACNSKTSDSRNNLSYQCPMKCEGEKTFTKKGSCAVCKMDLKTISNPSKTININLISEESIFTLKYAWKLLNQGGIVDRTISGWEDSVMKIGDEIIKKSVSNDKK